MHPTRPDRTGRRRGKPALLVALASLSCLMATSFPEAQNQSAVPARPTDTAIVHVLNRLGFGPRPGDVDRVRATGLSAYIDQQLHPERITNQDLEARLARFTTLTLSQRELSERYFLPALEMRRDQALRQQRAAIQEERSTERSGQNDMMTPGGTPPPNPPAALPPEARMAQAAAQNVVNELMQAKMLRATLSERQLEEVLTDFWFNHFNVFVGKGQVRQYLTVYERDAIRPHVLGHFRDLLGAVAHSPAMLFYLDNFQSVAPATGNQTMRPGLQRRIGRGLSPQQQQRMARVEQGNGRGRGLNENYAREIMELHTLGVDGGYTQQDVIELARILTGWTIDRPQQGGEFVFRPQTHDTGTKTFLGTSFKSGGESEGERALDLLANHPSTARHISYKLAQRFVADEPPTALVDRAAKVFLSTKGDLREVVRAIVTSPEFFADDVNRIKVKTPLEFVVSAVRATGAEITNAQPLVVAMRNLGMPLYGAQPPTGYSMTSDAWVNTGSLLNRMNFAVQLVSGGRVQPIEQARGGAAPARPLAGRGPLADRRAPAGGPIQIDVKALAPDTGDTTRDALVASLLGGQASAATTQTLARAQTPQNLIALTLGSPEFQRR